MKKISLIPALLLVFGSLWAQNSGQVKLRIQSKVMDDSKAIYCHNMFESSLFNALKTAFPCLSIITDDVIRVGLQQQKQLELIGLDNDNDRASFANNAMKVDFYIYVNVRHLEGDLISISAVCFDSKYRNDLASCVFSDDFSAVSQSSLKKSVQKLVDELKESEICTYMGPLTIEVKSDRDESETSYISSPCGGENANVTATRKVNMILKWELNKHVLHSGYGTVDYDLHENYTTITNFPCYKCKNGDQGPVKITEILETEAKTEGLSNESVSEGKQVSDVRISIVFFENGTYSILVKATSKEGVQKNSKEKKFEGMCESESEPKDTKTRRIDVPIDVTLGPYPGTANDITLHQKETKDLSQGKEKTTMIVDFTLTRKD